MATSRQPVLPHGDVAEFYRRHHERLVRAVARSVSAPEALIEDACQTAWAILLRRRPERWPELFGWLRTVAIHEAYRLASEERRDERLEDLGVDADAFLGGVSGEEAIEARRALAVLGALPEREREYLSLLIAGFSYAEIAELTGGRTRTNVNRHLVKARARIRRLEGKPA